MENLASIVGKNIAALRKAKGLTQQELALEVNYSDKSISKWELGYAVPSLDILMDIAKFFGVTIDYLTQEHSEESIDEAAKTTAKPKIDPNRPIIIAMTMMVIILVALSVFLAAYFVNNGENLPWWIFIWAVPVCCFLAAAEVRYYYHDKKWTIGLLSAFVWSLLLSFCFQYAFFNERHENIWFILTVGIPVQVILLLAQRIHTKQQ